jgi:signal peptidase I
MLPTLQDGDLVILQGIPFAQLHVGDIIVFRAPQYHGTDCPPSDTGGLIPCYIIHRIVKVDNSTGAYTITTQGDHNNNVRFQGIDYPVYSSDYVGRVILRIPYLGYVASFASPPYNYVIIGLLVVIIVLTEMYPSQKKEEPKSSQQQEQRQQ